MAFLVHPVQLLRHYRSRQRRRAGGSAVALPSWVSVTGCCHQGSPGFCQKDPGESQPFHELGQSRDLSWKQRLKPWVSDVYPDRTGTPHTL